MTLQKSSPCDESSNKATTLRILYVYLWNNRQVDLDITGLLTSIANAVTMCVSLCSSTYMGIQSSFRNQV